MGGCLCGGKDDDDKEEGGEYGKPTPYDPNFKGPIQKRCCTDILMLALFIGFWIGMIYIAAYGWSNGDPKRLLNPTDSEGRICGEGAYSDRSKLLFFDITSCIVGVTTFTFVCPTTQVCVSECPDENYNYRYHYYNRDSQVETLKEWPQTNKIYCRKDKTLKDVLDDEGDYNPDCAPYFLRSESVVGRCIPSIVDLDNIIDKGSNEAIRFSDDNDSVLVGKNVSDAIDGLSDFLNLRRIGEEIYSDLGIVWPHLLGGLFLILLLCLVYIFVLRFLVGIFVWLTIFIVFGLLIFGIGWSYIKYKELEDEPKTPTTTLETFTYQKKTYLALGIIFVVVFLILLLIVICLRQRIQIAIQLIKEASRAISNMWFTLLFPIVTFFLLVVVIVWFITVALWLQSAGDRVYAFYLNESAPGVIETADGRLVWRSSTLVSSNCSNDTEIAQNAECDPDEFNDCKSSLDIPQGIDCAFKEYSQSNTLFRMQIYNLFGLLWTGNYVLALGQCTLAGSFASYYWAFNKPTDIPSFTITRSFFRAFWWHTGSLAFGALIIAIIQFIRIVLAYMQKKLKGYGDNSVAQFFLKCLGCCFWCLEKIFKYINKNAYILIAVYGYHFCKACCRAFNLLMRNILRVFVLNSITTFIFFMSQLLIIGITGLVAFLVFDSIRESEELNYYLIPVILLALFAFFISWAFFSVYDMAVDTLFLCFLEDLERNDGSPEKPYYMAKGLRNVLGKKNKKPKGKDGDSTEVMKEESM